MLKQIKIGGRLIPYTLKISHRSRRLRLSVYGDGRLVITQPLSASWRLVESFIRAKANWLIARLDYFKEFPAPLLAAPGRRADYLAKKEAARVLVLSRLAHFNNFYGFKYHRISIRNQATRWGSCSRSGNLNFNYRLLDLAPAVADYIIVHELCHLAEFNHSARFWRLVAQAVPDYDEQRRALRIKIKDLSGSL